MANLPGLSDLAGGLGPNEVITPEQANQVSPEQVQEAAEHAQRANPSVVDQVSRFYAAHPTAVKALGTAAITLALQHIARRTS